MVRMPAIIQPGETLGQFRRIDSDEWARRRDEQFAAAQVAPFPVAWARRLVDNWRHERAADRIEANRQHLERCAAIGQAYRAGLSADASDAEIVQCASDSARDALRRVEQARGLALCDPVLTFNRPRAIADNAAGVLVATVQLWGLAAWLDALGLGDEWAATVARCKTARGAIRRACCERWWRAVLRRLHAMAVESTARALGLVHKRAGCYVSDESARRRAHQIQRNARALESVEAVNEKAQRYTLADLAARGPANREIRRHELMTRIAGFEQIAKDCGHVAIFVTLTCPASMHAYRTKGRSAWATEPNPRWDGATVEQGQQHLTRQWAKFRAAADRAGLALYGFRIAEPNHDGTPHWHCVLFFPKMAVPGRTGSPVRGVHLQSSGGAQPDARPLRGAGRRARSCVERPAIRVAVRLLRRYFLWQANPDERGARKHRVELKRIDWSVGSATGYIAKYVAKNIDGYGLEKDLYGNDCVTASQRVDAWASTHRIRQFQQIGGAPVGVWRELRRLHPEQAEASTGVGLALDAVNIAAAGQAAESEAMQRYTAAHGWADYLRLQGGPRVVRRSLRLRVLREQSGEIGRYGEPVAPKAVGVALLDQVCEIRPAFGIVRETRTWRTVAVEVESERCDWIIVPKGGAVPALHAQRAAGGEAARPWSPVTNCTHAPTGDDEPARAAIDAAHAMRRAGALEAAPDALFAPSVQRHRKRGRWHNWKAGRVAGAKSEERSGDGQPSDWARDVPGV